MLKGKRILIVDDEYLVALLAEDFVRDLGAEPVGPAATVGQALDLVRKGGIDAAILDVNLNGVQSEEVAHELMRRGVPFVVATGYGAIAWEGVTARVLAKPYDRSAIAHALTRSLSKAGEV